MVEESVQVRQSCVVKKHIIFTDFIAILPEELFPEEPIIDIVVPLYNTYYGIMNIAKIRKK